jgi:polyisoprenoid-binding protein YceI
MPEAVRRLGRGAYGVILICVTSGCIGDVGEGRVKAEVKEVGAEEVATPAAGTQLPVDVARSKLGVLGAKVTATHPITFHQWSGHVTLEGDEVRGVSFEVDVASLESDSARLDKHLRAEDFLHVEAYPKATFTSASVMAGAGAEGMTHTVSGDLTIRGKTKRVSFPARLTVAADAITAETEFTFDRKDFDVRYAGRADDLVQDNVVMKVSFLAPRS